MLEAVRKFGLAYCDFPTMLWNISILMRTLLLNIDPRNQKRIPILYIILNVAFAASYCWVYLVSMVWFVFWRCMETGDILQALIIFSLGASSQMGPYKLIFMFIYKQNLNDIVSLILASDGLAEAGSRFSTNLKRALRNVKKRAMIFWSVIMGNGFMYIIKPILLPGRHLMEDIFLIYGLEPLFETPNYQIAYILSAMGDCVSVYLPSNTTAFQIVIAGYIEAQMLAWSEELIHLWEDAENHYTNREILPMDDTIFDLKDFNKDRDMILNEFVNERLKDIIKAHATNLSLRLKMEKVFRGAIAVEFTLLMICLIAELLGGLENTYLQLPFALMQVGMDCFIGQRLENASIIFERAVYDCKWENFNKDNMKVVLTMMIMSQRTLTLSAGGIIMLNFVSFMAIVKSIYSAYTTLTSAIN